MFRYCQKCFHLIEVYDIERIHDEFDSDDLIVYDDLSLIHAVDQKTCSGAAHDLEEEPYLDAREFLVCNEERKLRIAYEDLIHLVLSTTLFYCLNCHYMCQHHCDDKKGVIAAVCYKCLNLEVIWSDGFFQKVKFGFREQGVL